MKKIYLPADQKYYVPQDKHPTRIAKLSRSLTPYAEKLLAKAKLKKKK